MIIDALLRAYADGSDVITLSLGGPGGWSESSASAVASNIVAAGRVVTISQGNSGSEGVMYASSPSSGKNVWSIGSLDNLGALAYRGSVSSLSSRGRVRPPTTLNRFRMGLLSITTLRLWRASLTVPSTSSTPTLRAPTLVTLAPSCLPQLLIFPSTSS